MSRAAPWLLVLSLCLAWNAAAMIHDQVRSGRAWLGGWDNNFYLAWGRSLAVDGDWNFHNDFAFVGSLTSLGDGARAFQTYLRDGGRTKTGRVPNKYASGTGILALPLLLLARLILALPSFVGLTAAPDPFSPLYVFAFTASGVLWGFVGVVTALALLRREYSPRVAWFAVLAGAIGLPLGYYVWFEPTMAHATGFGVATLYLVCVYGWADRVAAARERPANWRRWAFLMGLALGIACLVRFTNITLALVPVVLAWTLRSSPHLGDRSRLAVIIESVGLAAMGCVIGFLPQLIAWKIVYGAFVVNSYTGETLAAWPRQLLLVLFGLRNGLFSWTPLALVAVAGLVMGVRRRPMCRAGLVVLAATAWIYGSWNMYWLGHSFGMRGFVDASFFLLLGLAEIIRRVASLPRFSLLRCASQVVLVLLVLWTVHLIVCYRAQIQPHGEPLALRSILTEWKRWGEQVHRDTGLKLLIRHSPCAGSPPARGRSWSSRAPRCSCSRPRRPGGRGHDSAPEGRRRRGARGALRRRHDPGTALEYRRVKFLCLDCDQPMKLLGTEGPDEGSLAVTFRCPECGFRVAMLTNPFETQMVRSLGVKIGAGSEATPPAPFEHLRASLANPRADAFEGAPDGAASSDGPGCPFAAMLTETGSLNASAPPAPGGIAWTPEAEARIERIPSFIRPMAKKAVERLAESKGYATITEAVMDEARGAFGM